MPKKPKPKRKRPLSTQVSKMVAKQRHAYVFRRTVDEKFASYGEYLQARKADFADAQKDRV